VGFAKNPPLYLKNGDHMKVKIESIGELSNQVVHGELTPSKL